MALQGPQRPNFGARPSSPPAGSPQVDGLGEELVKQGRVSNQQQARDWARAVVQAIKSEGLLGASVQQSLTQIQQNAGLAPTGKLDPPTIRYIESKGWVPENARLPDVGKDARPAAERPPDAKTQEPKNDVRLPGQGAPPAGPKAGIKGPDGGRPPSTQGPPASTGGAKSRDPHVLSSKTGRLGPVPGEANRAPAVEKAMPDVARGIAGEGRAESTRNLGDLLSALMSLGFLGGKRGEALPDAVRSFQESAGLPTSGRLDPETAQALRKAAPSSSSSPEAPEGRGSGKGAGQEAKVDARASSSTKGAQEAAAAQTTALGERPTQSPTTDRARSSSENAQQAAITRGVAEGQPASHAGTAAEGEGAAVKSGKGGSGAGLDAAGVGAVDEGDEDGTEHHDANAFAGDEDLADEERGHANLDDGTDDDAGYWEVPPLGEQIRAALEEIERDDDGAGPATYRWDVTFYRPGVYGAYQPGEPLWHIGIERTGPFDPVWEEARRVLSQRLAQVDPDEPPLTGEDFELALRRARARAAG